MAYMTEIIDYLPTRPERFYILYGSHTDYSMVGSPQFIFLMHCPPYRNDSRFPIPDSRFPIPDSPLLPIR
ncbi:MAG: hypothetical protein F6J98_16820 [Moorea sp. SIO4G2]|nr:hypothetical protein [Moorena sp. SIO4A3]NEO62005.1 hypothetical protein [Moorena sp. SIO4G2]